MITVEAVLIKQQYKKKYEIVISALKIVILLPTHAMYLYIYSMKGKMYGNIENLHEC